MHKSLIYALILVAFGLTACSSAANNPLAPVSTNSTSSKPNFSQFAWLYDFTSKGLNFPSGPLTVGSNGSNLFGTTSDVGTYNTKGNGVYEITSTSAGSAPTVQTVYAFANGTYSTPQSGVTAGPDGGLYGTSNTGGKLSGCGGATGCGYIFKLKKSASGVWSEAWTYNLKGGPSTDLDGEPSGPPLLHNSKVYGTVNGYNACGGVYQINEDGSGYTEIYGFSGVHYCHPSGPLVADSSGNLYGTVKLGADGGCCGAVYELVNTASGYTFQVVYKFTGAVNGDGAFPASGVTWVGSDLYGTTNNGGDQQGKCYLYTSVYSGCGTIFALFPQLNGGWLESVLKEFSNEVGNVSGLVADGDTLYGVTQEGGSGTCYAYTGCGFIFSITTTGTYTKIHDFQGPPNDGGNPGYATPAMTSAGAIFGATQYGGTTACNCGTAYELPASYAKHKKHRLSR